MAFQPVTTLQNLPKTSDSFTVVDATPSGPTGFGSANAPANLAAITSIFGQVQPYAENPIQQISKSGDLTTGLTVNVPVPDGVDMLGTLYGENVSLNVTAISADRMTLTMGSDYTTYLQNVYALGDGTSFPVPIKSITSTTIVLYKPFPGTASTYSTLYRYFLANLTQLVLNVANGKLTADIAAFPILHGKCENLEPTLNDMMLIFSSQAAFANQNYAKAHEAARLVSDMVTLPTSTCKTC